MNILTDDLPTKIKVNNNIYDINYDYRTAIKILTAFEDNDLLDNEKLFIMLKLLYKNDIPEEDLEEACKKACKFLDLGQEKKENTKKESRIYSFKKDCNYIFSGITHTHNIDLEKEPNLHWWKFMALFMDMDTECTFNELVYYRKRKAEGKLTKEEMEQYKKLKDILELEPIETEETLKLKKAKEKFLKELNG